MKKGFRILVLSVILLLLLLIGGGYLFIKTTAPTYHGEKKLTGLSAEVQVIYDEYGIPHIYARNEADAYRALGYVHAQDRLFQMEMIRRVTNGELAEIFGPDLVETDHLFRTIGINRYSKKAVNDLVEGPSEPWKTAAMAYLEGVNAYVAKGTIPPEFRLLGMPMRPFTPENLYDVAGYMAFGFSIGLRADPILERIWQNLGPAYVEDLALSRVEAETHIPSWTADSAQAMLPPSFSKGLAQALELLPVGQLSGSNSWVLGPTKTTSGEVIFENDPHIGFAQPAVWYEAHLSAPGFSFYGNHLAGFPFAPIGHTLNHAIGMTMLENDDTNFYREKVNPENPNKIWYRGQWVEMESWTETIKVRDGADTTITIRRTPHGPVVNDLFTAAPDSSTTPISLWWTYLQRPSQTLKAAYLIAHSQRPDDVAAGASLMAAPGLNIMYGDSAGNIGWWATASLPVFPGEEPPTWRYLSGADSTHEVESFLPFDQNPHALNPPSGYVYSANNQPGPDGRGHWMNGYFAPRNRAQRIVELLEARDDWDAEAVKEMTLDHRSSVHAQLLQTMTASLPKTLEDEIQNQVLQMVAGWDGGHEPEAVAPTVYWLWRYNTLYLAMADELGEDDFENFVNLFPLKRSIPILFNNPESPWWDNLETEGEIETRESVMTEALDVTIQKLQEKFGNSPQDWTWSEAHSLTHAHPMGRQQPLDVPLNVGPYNAAGGGEVINNLDFLLNSEGIYTAKSGPSTRIIVDFSDGQHAWGILPSGNSGHPFSEHYGNQAEMYAQGAFRRRHIRRADVIDHQYGELILKPKE